MAEVIPPPYFITPTDRRGLVVVMTALVLAFVWTSLVIRLYLRVKLKEWKIDDSFLVAATVSRSLISAPATPDILSDIRHDTIRRRHQPGAERLWQLVGVPVSITPDAHWQGMSQITTPTRAPGAVHVRLFVSNRHFQPQPAPVHIRHI
jgi:hypothetical protein